MQLLPGLPHAWLIQEVEEANLEQAVAAGLDGVCPRANALTPEGVAAARAKGLYVRAWGVKTLEVSPFLVQGWVVVVVANGCCPWQRQRCVQVFLLAGLHCIAAGD